MAANYPSPISLYATAKVIAPAQEQMCLRIIDGTSKEDWWEPPTLYSDMPRLEAPDLWHLVGPAAFVMTETTAVLLGEFLHPAGELRPFVSRGQRSHSWS